MRIFVERRDTRRYLADVYVRETEETIAWIATALPVLRTMCKVAGLARAAAKAQEMIDYLKQRRKGKL
jgi:hypothetical protein